MISYDKFYGHIGGIELEWPDLVNILIKLMRFVYEDNKNRLSFLDWNHMILSITGK